MTDEKKPTRQIFNTSTQQVEEATLAVDHNNDIIATFENGTVVKFPAGMTKEEFVAAIAEHEKANTGQEIITPEMEAKAAAERKASEDLINDTADTTAGEEQSNAPVQPPAVPPAPAA